MDIEKKIEAVEEKIENRSFAMEILQELKESGKRWQRAFFAVLILLGLTIGAFLWYLNQYDYSSTVDAVGVYTAVDHSGNIVAQDISPEQWAQFERWLADYGESKGN